MRAFWGKSIFKKGRVSIGRTGKVRMFHSSGFGATSDISSSVGGEDPSDIAGIIIVVYVAIITFLFFAGTIYLLVRS